LHNKFKYITHNRKIIVPNIHLYVTNVTEILKMSEETVAREVSVAHHVVLSKNKTLSFQIDLQIR
jgi:hypothetical protein